MRFRRLLLLFLFIAVCTVLQRTTITPTEENSHIVRYQLQEESLNRTVSSWLYKMQIQSNDASRIILEGVTTAQVAPYPPPRRCPISQVEVHPIGFAVPYEMMMTAPKFFLSQKRDKFFSDSYPMEFGEPRRFATTHDEHLYLVDLMTSRFSLTKRRGGCDALRHYEILSQGALPYFFDIALCPNNTMGALPRDILFAVLKLRGLEGNGFATWKALESPINKLGITKYRRSKFRFFSNGVVNKDSFDYALYERLSQKSMEYTRTFLSTASLAKYIISRSINNNKGFLRVLALVEDEGIDDFLQIAIVHGFASLANAGAISSFALFPYVSRWFKRPEGTSLKDLSELRQKHFSDQHGKGYTFGFRAPRGVSLKTDFSSDQDVLAWLDEEKTTLVVYPRTVLKRSVLSKPLIQPMIDRTSLTSSSSVRLAFVDGNDFHPDPSAEVMELAKYGTVFRREMEDVVMC